MFIEGFELNFRLGNAIKYILRSNRKGNRLQDLKKAAWYLNREIEQSVPKDGDDGFHCASPAGKKS